MQRGSFFVKEHVLANVSFMSYAQVKGFARKCRNWIQTILYTYHFIEKGMFLQYVFKQSALCLIACLISSQQRSGNTAEQQVLLVESTVVVAPKDGQLVPVRGVRTLIHAHNSGTTCLRVNVPSQKLFYLHGLSSLSFCRWGPVTPYIINII